jgi:hypothetical protein
MSQMKLFLMTFIIVLASAISARGAVRDERAAAEETVRRYEHACEQFDFVTANSLLAAEARWIEDSYPESARFTGQGWSRHWQERKERKVQLHYTIRDLVTHIRGDVAWITLSLDIVATADTPEAIKANGDVREWRGTYVESYVLLKRREAWRVALGHTSLVPTTGAQQEVKKPR